MKKNLLITLILIILAGILGFFLFSDKNISISKQNKKINFTPDQQIVYDYQIKCLDKIVESGENIKNYVYKTPIWLKQNIADLKLGKNKIKLNSNDFEKYYDPQLKKKIPTQIIQKVTKIEKFKPINTTKFKGIIVDFDSGFTYIDLNPAYTFTNCTAEIDIKKVLLK